MKLHIKKSYHVSETNTETYSIKFSKNFLKTEEYLSLAKIVKYLYCGRKNYIIIKLFNSNTLLKRVTKLKYSEKENLNPAKLIQTVWTDKNSQSIVPKSFWRIFRDQIPHNSNDKRIDDDVATYITYRSNVLAAQSCLTLWDPKYCSPPGSSVHRISQARILE